AAQPLGPPAGAPSSGTLADTARWPATGGLRIFQPWVSPTRTPHYGADCSCDVEFWKPATDGGRTALRPTLLGDALHAEAFEPAEIVIAGRAYPALQALARTLTDDHDFPVDAVYTWVDGDDTTWRTRRDTALAGTVSRPADGGDSRYSSRDELRYSLRSLAVHAPWIRHVWIVTDGQRPGWLRDGDGLTVVDHREIFADPEALPTFNSHAIETRLHHIDGLSEHFLYLNDDFFLGRPLTPGAFFHPNGITKYFASPLIIPPAPRAAADPTWLAAAKNNRALIERDFGRTTTHAFKHAPYALRRSVLAELEERYPEEFRRTARSRVRSVADLSVVSSLYHYYALCTGRAVPGGLKADTVRLSHRADLPMLTRLLAFRDRDVFCLNDMASGDLDESGKWHAATGFLESYFPHPGPHERDC
ncbi:stealth family protein, partial [Actinocorallia lasiicapitis]